MNQKVFFVNGVERNVILSADATLADVLRKQLKLTGTKVGCDQGQCGACSVIMDGKVVRSCVTKMSKVPDGAQVTTIEGIGQPGNLHPLQQAWILHGGAQCGFCSPGVVMKAEGLLRRTPTPSRDVIAWALAGNLCRCTGYVKIIDAIEAATKE